jgi:hypothetical protein
MDHRTVALLSALLFSSACGGPFAVARRDGSSAAYASFVARYPDHPKAAKAAARAESIDWASARAIDDADGYARYVATHPTGPNVAEARALADERAWAVATRANTLAAYHDYAATFPQGKYAADAKVRVDDVAMDQARLDDSVDSYGRYLFRYPDGRHVEEARARRDELAWGQTTAEASREAYLRYLQENPRGQHRDEAREWLQALAITSLQPVLRVGSSWRPIAARAADSRRLREQVELGLLADVRREVTVLPLIVESGTADDDPRASRVLDPGVGVLLIAVSEEVGRDFEPNGHATDLPTTMSIWAGATAAPLWTWTGKGSTPERVTGSTEEALYTEAVQSWAGLLRSAVPPIARLKEPEIP